ncbi:MAG: hypothetical protein AB8C84_06165 [Oligoflexales bacterium]
MVTSSKESSLRSTKTPDALSTPATSCTNCLQKNPSRRRHFSEQAWAALLAWSEVSVSSVKQPICEHCYEEMREVLIDRIDEVDAIQTGQQAS